MDEKIIDWYGLNFWDKTQLVNQYIFKEEYLEIDDVIGLLNNVGNLMKLLDKKFPRGFRWRPDNKLLTCYGNYDEPATQIDCETFSDGGWIILLRLEGVNIIQQ